MYVSMKNIKNRPICCPLVIRLAKITLQVVESARNPELKLSKIITDAPQLGLTYRKVTVY